MLHKLHAPSLDLYFNKGFLSVGRNRGYAAPSKNPLLKQISARSSREFMNYPGI
jgi:hypothetical protein